MEDPLANLGSHACAKRAEHVMQASRVRPPRVARPVKPFCPSWRTGYASQGAADADKENRINAEEKKAREENDERRLKELVEQRKKHLGTTYVGSDPPSFSLLNKDGEYSESDSASESDDDDHAGSEPADRRPQPVLATQPTQRDDPAENDEHDHDGDDEVLPLRERCEARLSQEEDQEQELPSQEQQPAAAPARVPSPARALAPVQPTPAHPTPAPAPRTILPFPVPELKGEKRIMTGKLVLFWLITLVFLKK